MMTTAHRNIAVLTTVLTLGFSLSACSSMNQTGRGAAIGAAGGAAVGAVIGNQVGSTARGAIIGAAVGGAAGAIIGRQMDKQAEQLAMSIPGATVQRVGEGIVVTFDSGILFDFDKAELKPAARENLANLARSLMEYDGTEVLLVGHTDSVGSDEYNQALSERRAQAARSYLISLGVSSLRIKAVGRGESEPIASNDTEAGRAENRRVEVAIFAGEAMRRQAQSTVGD